MAIDCPKAQGGCGGKEEACMWRGGGISQRGRGLGRCGLRGSWVQIPPATWRTGGVLTTPPSTRLTAWVCLLQPWSPRHMCPPPRACPHTCTSMPRPRPHSPRTRERGHGLALPSYPESFLLASCLFTPQQVGAHRGHSLSVVCPPSPWVHLVLINPLRGASSSAPSAHHLPARRRSGSG